jgi:hypothetical protein
MCCNSGDGPLERRGGESDESISSCLVGNGLSDGPELRSGTGDASNGARGVDLALDGARDGVDRARTMEPRMGGSGKSGDSALSGSGVCAMLSALLY